MNFVGSHQTHDRHGSGAGATAVRLVLRFFQFVLGIAVIGLYAQDLDRARKAGSYADSKWVFATVTGTLSAIWALLMLVPRAAAFPLFFGDALIWLFWLVVFGIFGKMYIKEDPENVGHGDGPGIQRMKNAVWVDLINMLLWLVTAAWGAVLFLFLRRRSLHTGRAEV